MRIFNRSAVLHYARLHADARGDLLSWYAVAEKASWNGPQDVKAKFPNASIIANNRVVFNIKGNDYRLIVSFNYKYGACYIKFFGSHAQYDNVKAETVDVTGVVHGKSKRRN